MPDIHPGLLFLILVFAVPLQFYLSPSSSSDMKYYLQRLTDSIIHFSERIGIRLPFLYIRKGYEEKSNIEETGDDSVVDEQERKNSGSYGNSLEVRERAPHVKWRVGQVIKHKVHGYRGVIIGWDLTAKASKEFIERVHKGNKDLINSPNYAILIDVRDRLTPQLGYVAQDNIELHGGRIIHNLIGSYMERYDEAKQKYIPKPWLQRIYPDD